MNNKYSQFVVIGPGKLGKTLISVLFEAGLSVAAIGVRKPENHQNLAKKYNLPIFLPSEAAKKGNVIFLCVSDDSISSVCQELAGAGALAHKPLVIHCSGAVNSEELSPAAAIGCEIASFHPLQTFPDAQSGIDKWKGTYCFIESPCQQVREFLKELAENTGAKGIDIEPQGKALYHAASVVCCNYLTALLDVSLAMYAKAGIDESVAREAVAPIVRATVENVLANGTAASLTGPIARGDTGTIMRHLEAIDNDEIENIYKALGQQAAKLAQKKGSLDNETFNRIQNLLGKQE